MCIHVQVLYYFNRKDLLILHLPTPHLQPPHMVCIQYTLGVSNLWTGKWNGKWNGIGDGIMNVRVTGAASSRLSCYYISKILFSPQMQ